MTRRDRTDDSESGSTCIRPGPRNICKDLREEFEAYNIQGGVSNERSIAELISCVILIFWSSVQCEVIVVALTAAVPVVSPVCAVSYTVVLDIPAAISPGSRLTTGKDVVISPQFTFEELI